MHCKTWWLVVSLGLASLSSSSCTDTVKKPSTYDAGTPVPAEPGFPVTPIVADPPPPPEVEVDLVLGDGVEPVVYPGYPVVVRGAVFAMNLGTDGGVAIDDGSLSLTVSSDAGPVSWPFERLTPPGLSLTSAEPVAVVEWVLDATKTTSLPLGGYALRFSGAGDSRTLAFEVRAPPSSPSREWLDAKVAQDVHLLLVRKQTADALTKATTALDAQPTSLLLMHMKYLALRQSGDLPGALQQANDEATLWKQKNPGKRPGPTTNLDLTEALDAVLKVTP